MTHTHRYDPSTQVNHITIHQRGDGAETTSSIAMRMYYPQELDALLKYNGFTFEAKYGDYDERPFDATAMKQLVVCRTA